MSSHYTEEITCPKCGQPSNFIIWNSINTVINPEMYHDVRSGEAFLFQCPSCGHRAYVNFACLYHQMDDELMVYYVPDDEGVEEVYDMFNGNGKAPELVEKIQGNYLKRIVRSQNDLREKLFIFDAGLDDRAIEILKVLHLQNLQEKNPAVQVDEVLFDTENNDMGLIFLAGGRAIGSCRIDSEIYDMVVDTYLSDRPDIRLDDMIIDFNWALHFFDNRE